MESRDKADISGSSRLNNLISVAQLMNTSREIN